MIQARDCLKVPLLIEGPYGHSRPIENYDVLVFLAGGIGITAAYSYISKLVHNTTPKQVIVLTWVIQTVKDINWLGHEVLSLADNTVVRLKIHLTKHLFISGSDDEQEVETVGTQDTALVHENFQVRDRLPSQKILEEYSIIHSGKPDVGVEVKNLISQSTGDVGVFSCGPPVFIDNIRSSIVHNIHDCKHRVDYFEEAFSW